MQWLTGGAMGVKDIAKPNIFGIVFETQAQLYYFILVIAILLIIFSVRLTKSKYGRARSRLSAITPRQSSPSA